VPGGQAGALARLASYHEAFHGFLNSSSTFGNAMILAGALVQSGALQLTELVERMVASSVLTHECFATVSALCSVTEGRMDGALLDGEYLDLLTMFHGVFGSGTRPFLACVALTSCARAAMQTPIYGQLLALHCKRWPDIVFSPPDERFRAIFRKDTAAAAMAEIDRILVSSGEIGERLVKGVTSEVEHELTVQLGTALQEVLSKVSFDVFAEAIEIAGYGPKPDYDAERNGLRELILLVQAFAGPALKTEFRVAEGAEDDIDAVLTDYRRETLSLRDAPDPIALMDHVETMEPSIADFQSRTQSGAWLQLVAMPIEKLRALYRITLGENVLLRAPGPMVTGVRRTVKTSDGSLQIEYYILSAAELSRFAIDNPDMEIVAVATTSVTYDAAWRLEWLTPDAGAIERLPLLIDTDPFALLRSCSGRGPTRVFLTGVPGDGGGHTEIICIAEEDTPGVIYFTPCSTPYRQAVLEYAHRHCPNVSLSAKLDAEWRSLLSRLLPRILDEERCFGVGFWT
jgi:hypothetical protein